MKPLIGDYTYIDDLPEESTQFEIEDGELYFKATFKSMRSIGHLRRLPPGKWKIVGLSDEIGEVEKGNIVIKDAHYSRQSEFNPEYGHYQTSGSSTIYKDYVNIGSWLDTRSESFQSLLSSKSIETRVLILKKDV